MVVHGQRKIEISHSVWFKGFDIWEYFHSFPSFLYYLRTDRLTDKQTVWNRPSNLAASQTLRIEKLTKLMHYWGFIKISFAKTAISKPKRVDNW